MGYNLRENFDVVYIDYDPKRKIVGLKDEHGKYWICESSNVMKFHREDGPAMIYLDGYIEWWFNDYKLTFEDWCRATKKTDEEIVQLKLMYSSCEQ